MSRAQSLSPPTSSDMSGSGTPMSVVPPGGLAGREVSPGEFEGVAFSGEDKMCL